MKKILPLIFIVATSCWGVRTVNQVARKNDLSVKRVGGVNLLGGKLDITNEVVDKERSFYLFYRADTLVYISDDKEVGHMGEFIYQFQRPGDSIYMLTRRADFRYFREDTVLFHSNYIVSNRVLYGHSSMDEHEAIQSYFTTYHFTEDSVIEISYRSEKPIIGVHQYSIDSKTADRLAAARSSRHVQPLRRIEDVIHSALR